MVDRRARSHHPHILSWTPTALHGALSSRRARRLGTALPIIVSCISKTRADNMPGASGHRQRSAKHSFREEHPRKVDALPENTESGSSSPCTGTNLGAILLSLLTSAYCVAFGVNFSHGPGRGPSCRAMLGDSLWAGAQPKIVILNGGSSDVGGLVGRLWTGGLRGGCNYTMISSIVSVATAYDHTSPLLERLPASLARLRNLKSLQVLGHRIASDGVPVSILDGTSLEHLTRLEFGNEAPVKHDLDLSGTRGLSEFPPYVLKFMTDLEILRLRGTDIACFPPREKFSRLQKLRTLDLSSSQVNYLPPSVLFDHTLLDNLNLSDTPVWISLDWSAHGLGTTTAFASNYADSRRRFRCLKA